MSERHDLLQPFRLPAGPGLALFQGLQAFPAQELQQERPAPAMIQYPRNILDRERDRRVAIRAQRFRFRSAALAWSCTRRY